MLELGRNGRTGEGLFFHIIDIPVGLKQTRVDDPHVLPVVLDILLIPKCKGIIVSYGK